MAYRELVKDYERIRDYMRQFYVYGFKSRGEYDAKSARSYDNERRRVESWLGDYMSFCRGAGGKNVFLSVDSRGIRQNPLYKSFKAKSFTDKDITLHFYLLDLLAAGQPLAPREILDKITADYLPHFSSECSFDESTVRKKLKEYEAQGLLTSEKCGREVRYALPRDSVALASWRETIAFFSEENPVGVIGSFLLDRFEEPPAYFGFKHHYILHALNSQVLCELLVLMRERRAATLSVRNPQSDMLHKQSVFPLKIYSSTQTGRQYLLCYSYRAKHLLFLRLDFIRKIVPGAFDEKYETYNRSCERFRRHLWGVSAGSGRSTEHLEMTVHVDKGEEYIPRRLEREKRHGTVEQLDACTWRFAADVYDAAELRPWLRSFLGQIVELKCSNQSVTDTFYADFKQMVQMYKEDDHAVQ